MGCIGGHRAQRAFAHRNHLIVIDCPGPTRTDFIHQAFDTVLQKASSPFADGMLVDAQFRCHHLARQAVGAAKNETAALRQGPRNPMTPDLVLEIRSLIRTQDYSLSWSPRRIDYHRAPA